jgi:DNA-binding SARP family transcriptional activator
MEYRILGPIEVWHGGRAIALGRGLGRTALAALVLSADRVVTPEVLADAVWNGAEPASWRKALQMHVGRLRTALGADAIETTVGGYQVAVNLDAVDGFRFIASMQRPAVERDDLMDDVLALWRGRPYDELGEWPPAVRARRLLEALHADAVEARMRSRVQTGDVSVVELEQLVYDEPGREHRWALLIVGLYREGRQAEALRAFVRARTELAERFGIDPGANLVALQRAVLDQDPRLQTPNFDITTLATSEGTDVPRIVSDHRRRAAEDRAEGDIAAAQRELETALALALQNETDARVAIDLYLEVAELARQSGNPAHAVAATRAAADLARLVREPSRLAQVALTASGEGWLTGIDPDAPPIVLLDEALTEIRSAPSPLRARLLARRAVAVSNNRPNEIAQADATEALALARVLGDPETLAVALHARVTIDHDLNHLSLRAALADELAQLGESYAKASWRAWAAPARARIYATRGNFDRARDVLEELETQARAAHDPVGLYHAGNRHILTATIAGDFETAAGVLQRGRDAAVRALMDPTAADLAYHGAMGILRLVHGVPVDSPFDDEIEWPQETMHASFLASIALGAVQRGDLGRARAAIQPVTPEQLATLDCDLYWPLLAWMVTAVSRALEDRERADALLGHAIPIADLYLIDPGGIFLGSMHHHVGLLAATIGETDLAKAHLSDAIAAHRHLGAHLWLTRSEHELLAIEAQHSPQ